MEVVVFLEAAFIEDEMSTTLRVRSSGSAFLAEIIRELRKSHTNADNKLFK